MYTRQRTRKSGGALIAPKALGRVSGQREGSESPGRVPEWGSVAPGSPDRRAADGRDTFPAPTRGREAVRERETERDTGVDRSE